MESNRPCKLETLDASCTKRISVCISAVAASEDFLVIADGCKLYKYSIRLSKITQRAKLDYSVNQIVIAEPRRVLAFNFQSEKMYVMNEELQLLHSMEFRVNYSDSKEEKSLCYCSLIQALMYVKTGGKIGLLETFNLQLLNTSEIKVSETLVRLMVSETTGSSFAIATVNKERNGFILYWSKEITAASREDMKVHLEWSSIDKLNARELSDLVISKSPRRIYLSIETEDGEPQVVVLSPQLNTVSLTVSRIISIPDFRAISSLRVVDWGKALIVGCLKHMVIFREEGTPKEGSCNRFKVTKILTHMFEESVDFIWVLHSGLVISGSRRIGINISTGKLKEYDAEEQMRISLGFKLV